MELKKRVKTTKMAFKKVKAIQLRESDKTTLEDQMKSLQLSFVIFSRKQSLPKSSGLIEMQKVFKKWRKKIYDRPVA